MYQIQLKDVSFWRVLWEEPIQDTTYDFNDVVKKAQEFDKEYNGKIRIVVGNVLPFDML